MIDETDQAVQDWMESQVTGVDISFAVAGKQPGKGVGLYLLEMMQSLPPSTTRRAPLQLQLRYLVTSWAEKPQEAHKTLGQLLFAAMEHKEWQVEMEPVPLAAWRAFGVSPQPSFILRVPVRQERPEHIAPLVRKQPIINTTALVGLYGVLLGPDDIPLSNSRVEIPSLHLSTSTDQRGRFHFAGIPSQSVTKLVVKARGREIAVSSEGNYPNSSQPLVIHFSPLEA